MKKYAFAFIASLLPLITIAQRDPNNEILIFFSSGVHREPITLNGATSFNPVITDLTLKKALLEKGVRIYDNYQKLLFKTRSNLGHLKISTENFPPGMCILNIMNKDGITQRKYS